MRLMLSDWTAKYAILCIIISILWSLFVFRKSNKSAYHRDLAFIFGQIFIFFVIFVCGIMSIHPNPYIEVSKSTEISMRGYYNRSVYGELQEVNECVNKGYNGEYSKLDSSDYYYDYLDITLENKPVNLSGLLNYIKTDNPNLIYYSTIKLHKVTVKLKLEGILKPKIENGITTYLINDYVLGVDEKSSIASLANNQKISLDIIYSKDLNKNDKKIMDYRIINANVN